MLKRIIRYPAVSQTPRRLGKLLGVPVVPVTRAKKPSFEQDFLFVYPPDVEGSPDNQMKNSLLHGFFHANKARQREIIQASGLPIPWTARNKIGGPREGRFIVRPLHHSRGQNYRLTDNSHDFNVGHEYISEVFEKRREYRLVYVHGELVALLRKHPQEGTPREAAWGHEVSTFRTVNDHASSKLAEASALEVVGKNPIVKNAHIIAVDVLWKKGEFVVLEFNSSPSISIDGTLEKVVEVIKGKYDVRHS